MDKIAIWHANQLTLTIDSRYRIRASAIFESHAYRCALRMWFGASLVAGKE